MDQWVDGWMDDCADGRMNGCMAGWMTVRMDGWMDGRTEGLTSDPCGPGGTQAGSGKEPPRPSLFRVLAKLVGPWLVVGFVQKVVSDGFLVLSPVLLG